MKLGLDFLKELQNADHWEMLEALSDSLTEAACNVRTIGQEFDGIADARRSLADSLAKIEVYKEVVKHQLFVVGEEWDTKVAEALELVREEYRDTEVDTPTIVNIDDLI